MDDALPEQRFLDREWDVCIVLDACRYDRFAAKYQDYLVGDLQRLVSPGSSTPEWAYRTFTDHHDVAYFSGNPFVNGLGIPLNELKWGASCDYDWAASDHIETVIDVWKEGWDDDLGTVPPGSLAQALERHRESAEAAERIVLHYMQPHAPYLDRETSGKLSTIKNGIQSQGAEADGGDPGIVDRIGDAVRPRVEQFLEGRRLAQKAGMWVELDKRGILTSGTRATALQHYDRNLEIVLESVTSLIPELEGDVVVTADHGEAFGEHGIWEHHIETHIPPLIEVPWIEVEAVR
ncbi:hypothetical protein L593_00320 [Salinarchaeum sp. Harcht-Bsk1]|nr:hypothetical protein L593_00320 [Salinarchaeum sp. Harcht-Bsk1]